MKRAAYTLLACLLLALPLGAQTDDRAGLASLVADSIRIEADNALIAEGNVEVFFDGARLTAQSITFSRGEGTLEVEGPIRLYDGTSSVLFADSAKLGADLTEGILRSARLVLDRQLQLAAAEISRDRGRYTRLRRVVASSCEVCLGDPAPLWEIRASGVVHDQLERQLYFEDAQVRVIGIPVFYVPRLRLPDPTLDRATGFLVPDIRTTSDLGTGLKFPYFIRLGESADLTLEPYLSPATTTLEARYRQAFANGSLRFQGAYTFRDDILGGDPRGFAFVEGRFRLPREFRLDLRLEQVTDRAYLLDYDFSDADRLDSEIAISRTRRDEFIRAGIIRYETLREADIGIEDTLPQYVGEASYLRRVATGALGGDAWLSFDARTLTRPSEADVIGRDVSRIGAAIDWRRDWMTTVGMVIEASAGLSFDVYHVRNDSTFSSTPIRRTPRAAVGLRWPFERREANGARQVLEPVAQLVWSDTQGDAVPNEDSILVEFDEGNLFAFSRFPGDDRQEDGLRANLGVSWWRTAPGGMAMGATVGRILRFDAPQQFSDGTGLSGSASDWLLAARLRMTEELSLTNRTLIAPGLAITRNETRFDWQTNVGSVSTSYLWSVAVPDENRPDPLSEWALEASYGLSRNWEGRVGWRYDFENDRAARAGLGLRYRNECIGVDLSVSRRFTSSIDVTPSTSVNLRVSLNGFGTGNEGRDFRRSCSG